MPNLYAHFLLERLLLQNIANFYDSLFVVILLIFISKLGPEEFLPPVHASYFHCCTQGMQILHLSQWSLFFKKCVFLTLRSEATMLFLLFLLHTSLLDLPSSGNPTLTFLVCYCFSNVLQKRRSLCYYVYSSELLQVISRKKMGIF